MQKELWPSGESQRETERMGREKEGSTWENISHLLFSPAPIFGQDLPMAEHSRNHRKRGPVGVIHKGQYPGQRAQRTTEKERVILEGKNGKYTSELLYDEQFIGR